MQLLRCTEPGEKRDAQQANPARMTSLGAVEDESGVSEHGGGENMKERDVQLRARGF